MGGSKGEEMGCKTGNNKWSLCVSEGVLTTAYEAKSAKQCLHNLKMICLNILEN